MQNLNIAHIVQIPCGTTPATNARTEKINLTIPVADSIAEDILENGANSTFLDPECLGNYYQMPFRTAEAQGYRFQCFWSVEPADKLQGDAEAVETENIPDKPQLNEDKVFVHRQPF